MDELNEITRASGLKLLHACSAMLIMCVIGTEYCSILLDPADKYSRYCVDAIHLVYVWFDRFSFSDTFWRHIHLFSSGDTVERIQ